MYLGERGVTGCDGISPHLQHISDNDNGTKMRDLFFWSIFYDNPPIGRALWPHCEMPVHVALLGSAISR